MLHCVRAAALIDGLPQRGPVPDPGQLRRLAGALRHSDRRHLHQVYLLVCHGVH